MVARAVFAMPAGSRPRWHDLGISTSTEEADLFRLAAAYAHGIISGHPFVDGNKRTSFVISTTFLAGNGIPIAAQAHDVHETWTRLASGLIGEREIADWFEAHQSGGRPTIETPVV